MRYWYINKRREKVFKTGNLFVLACLAVIILVAIQPKTGAFRDMLGSLQPDVVALNYARVLVALSPEDTELKTLLAQQYANLGRYAEADAVLIGSRSEVLNPTHTMLHLSVLRQRLYASTGNQQKRALQKRVVELLRLFDTTELSTNDQINVAQISLAFGQPLIAAQIYERTFLTTRNPKWALLAGEHYEAAALPALAALAYSRASTIPGNHIDGAISHALRLFLAANDFDAGIRYLSSLEPALLSRKSQENAVYFALSADAPVLAGTYAQLLARDDENFSTTPDSRTSFDDLVNAALAINDLDTAKHFAERAVNETPNNARLRKQLAQVLEWRGEVEASLEHWVWLANHDPPNAEIERTWRLAQSAYQHPHVADLLRLKSRTTQLSAREIDAWLAAEMARNALGQTIENVRSYVERFPNDEYAWKAGARLLDENESLEEALAWWNEIEQRYELTSQDQRAVASIHWRLFDLPAALLALEKVDIEEVSYNAPYWRDVGELAYQTGRRELANDALSRLAAFDKLSAEEYDMLFETMPDDASNDRRYHANKAWELTGALRFLLKAMEAEFDVDAERFERLLRVADSNFDALRGNPLYWTLKGQHFARTNRPADAESSFRHALALAPSYAPAVSGYAWLLVEQRKLTELWQLLDSRPELALEHRELAAPFAAGYMLLARYDEAAFWYRKALDASPDDMYLALEYSGALMKTGRVDEAAHWRRDTLLKALAKMPDVDGLDVSALRTLSTGMLSRPDFERLVHALNSDDLRPVIRTLINDQLDQQHWDAARYWVAYAEKNDIELDDYPKFMMAHQGRDMRGLDRFKTHERPTMRAEALLASREDARALITALRQINTRTPEGDRLMLTRMAADISVNRPSGVKTNLELRDFGTVSTTVQSIDVTRTFDTVTLSASAENATHEIDDALVSHETELTETAASVRVSGQTERGSWEVAAGIVDSPTGTLTPTSVTLQRQWDQSQSSVARVAIDQQPDETPILRAFGKKNSVSLGHTWQPTARDTLSAQGAAEWFADRDGEKLSNGYRLELGWQHAVFFERPAVIARAAISSSRRSSVVKSKSLSQQITDLAFGDLLPERTDRIGLGITLAHGQPGGMNWQVPSPRYRLDFDVGYQWPDNKPTYEISASAGVRLFGDDELAFKLSYASRPDLGIQASGYALGLTYNYRLGR